jgi:hypothetical protein
MLLAFEPCGNAQACGNIPRTRHNLCRLAPYARSSFAGDTMAQLLFRCPYTNRPIASGIELDRTDAAALRAYPIRLRCPHCKLDHHGKIGDGELREAA